jgi:4-amino-4-deoxy-L-arabinose transferase-like glycosyltransferase
VRARRRLASAAVNDRTGRRDLAPLWLALAAIAVALLSHHYLFPAYSWNRDEVVYLWQVDGLRHGMFTTPTGGFPQFFHPWLAGVSDGRFFSQYTLGWPLPLLASELLFGTAAGALALGAALAVVGTYLLARELTVDRRVARIAGIGMLVSPILVIQSGVYLGYLFTLGLGLLFTTAIVSATRTGRYGRCVGAGFLLGWVFMTRPFDAVLWGGAVVVALGWVHRRELGRVARAVGLTALGALPPFIATLAYNQHVTGSFTQFPITAADPLDTFGFGHKRIMPTFHPATYTVGQALRSTAKQVGLLPLFLGGGYVLAVLALIALWRHRREAWVLVVVLVAAAFPAGYFFFWGMFVSSPTMPLSGPIYMIPIFPLLLIAGAVELIHLWQHRRAVAWGAIVLMVVVTVPVGVNRAIVNRNISRSQVPWKTSADRVPRRSLVFVWRAGDYLMFINPYSSNAPRLNGPVLYAVDRGARNLRLMDAYPGRKAFIQRASIPPTGDVPTDSPATPRVTLTPIRVQRARDLAVAVRFAGGPLPAGTSWYVTTPNGRVAGLGGAAPAGTAAFTLTAGAGGADRVPVTGSGTVAIGVGKGPTAAAAARNPTFREELHYRVRNGVIELLTPFESFARRPFDRKMMWFAVAPGVASTTAPVTRTAPVRLVAAPAP